MRSNGSNGMKLVRPLQRASQNWSDYPIDDSATIVNKNVNQFFPWTTTQPRASIFYDIS